MLLDLADFALQEQPEDNLIVAISRAWYNDSYTMVAKPIKSLELHYTVIQLLINIHVCGSAPAKASKYNKCMGTKQNWLHFVHQLKVYVELYKSSKVVR